MVMALFCLGTFAAASGVTFLLKNGTKVTFAFSAKPAISVSSDGITVSAQDQDDVSYQFSDVQRFFFEGNVETAVEGVKAETPATPVFSYVNGVVEARGLVAGERVSVYSIGGSKVNEAKADQMGHASVDVSHVPAGVYVVSTGSGVSFKLLKK